MMTTLAFIGLGHMGGPMARNLVRAGYRVHGYDLVPHLSDAAAEVGVHVAESGVAAVTDADIVITMLPEGRHVLSAYEGGEAGTGLLAAASPNTLFLDCSTINVADAQQAARAAIRHGHRALEAPVSGGVIGAEEGTLTFMVGGDAQDVEEVRPVLSALGKRIVHCGGAGLGQAAKMCNNLILGVTQIAVAEAFVLAEAVGLDQQVLFDVASNASGQCWALTTNCPVPGPVPSSPANRGYEPGFASALMAKDLTQAERAIQHSGVDARLALLAHKQYARFAAGEGGQQDFSAIIHMIRGDSADASTPRGPDDAHADRV